MMEHEKKKNGKKMTHAQKVQLLLMCFDVFAILASYFLALLLRFDFRYSSIPSNYLHEYLVTILPYAAVVLIIFVISKNYRSVWRFASFVELYRILVATAISLVIHILGTWVSLGLMPVSYYLFGIVLQFGFTCGIRFSYRFLLLLRSRSKEKNTSCNVMVIGAGESGQMILRDMKHIDETWEKAVCIIDDNPNKWGRYIDGVPILGGREKIPEQAKNYNIRKIYLAIPSSTAAQKQAILELCKETGCEIMVLPGTYQLRKGEVTVNDLKEVSIEDLLERDIINPEEQLRGVYNFLKGKKVMVTGGGGSIGSELCRQIAAHDPKQLIIFDIYENNAYDIQLELKEKYPDLDLVTLIGSVRDSRRIFNIFKDYKPDVVYHAAAHKHVPLMEDSPNEAIKNNVIGTYKTAYAAIVHGCERFVLISTDKAVNPTNIMGASKRLCEMIVQGFNQLLKEGRGSEITELFTHAEDDINGKHRDPSRLNNKKTEFVAVRFGNVLGSNGSVIPIFKKQIAKGGPVTVTHPDITRYFMTIPEAVGLVLIAGTYANGGEIMVLDMGNPVKIDTLARNMIKLSGLIPDVDIKVEYTGLRPGEKLFEERLMSEEGLKKTENELISIGQPIPFDIDAFLRQLHGLMEEAYDNELDIRKYVEEMVPTYHPASH